jgi:dihydroorotase
MLESELAAAAAGGVTSLVCPPDTDPVLDEPGLVEMLKFRARKLSRCRLFPLGALTRGLAGETLTEMAELTEAGCVGFSQADVPVADTLVLLRALQYASTFGYTVWLHPLDALAGQGRGGQRRAGHAAGPVGRAGGGRDHRAAHHLRAGARHRRARAPVPAVQRRRRGAGARRQGRGPAGHGRREHQLAAPDRCRHRLLQRRDAPEPPLRQARDRDALREALADGTLDALVSDHNPVAERRRTCRSPRPSPAPPGWSCC